MANLTPIPQKVLVTDERGYVSQPWLKWFLDVLERTNEIFTPGDLTALINDVDAAQADIIALESDVSDHETRITALEAASGGSNVFELYQTNDVDDAGGGVTYVGKATTAGKWLLVKSTETTGDITNVYANESNNGGTTTFATAWTNRASLTYGRIETLTGI